MSNPFSTRYVTPGAIAYLFPSGESADTVLARLREHNWFGAIVGPHGSGKSSLLATLVPAIEANGWRVESFALHDGEQRLPVALNQLPPTDARRLVIVDGYEQLSAWNRWRLRRQCRRRGWGLLVTSHAPTTMVTIYRTEPTLELAQRIVERLLDGQSRGITAEDVEREYQRHAGDLRETLFGLYDLYESQRSRGA